MAKTSLEKGDGGETQSVYPTSTKKRSIPKLKGALLRTTRNYALLIGTWFCVEVEVRERTVQEM